MLKYIFIILISLYVITVLVVGRLLTYLDMFLPRKKPDGKIDLKGYIYEDLSFTPENNLILKGWFIPSSQGKSDKTVIIIPGWMKTRSNYLPHIKLFVNSGFNVLTYDQRSHGASGTGVISYGPNEGKDLKAVYNCAKKEGYLTERTVAIGFSLGTTAAIYAGIDHIFKSIVVEGVFSSSFDMGEEILKKLFGPFFTKIIGYGIFWVGAKIWTLGKFEHSQPSNFISKITPTPIMIIQGKNDKMVPSYSSDKMVMSACEPKEIWKHNGGHTNSLLLFKQEYKEKVLHFINQNI